MRLSQYSPFDLNRPAFWKDRVSRIPIYPNAILPWDHLSLISTACHRHFKTHDIQLGVNEYCLYIAYKKWHIRTLRWQEIQAIEHQDHHLVIQTHDPIKPITLPRARPEVLEYLQALHQYVLTNHPQDNFEHARLFAPDRHIDWILGLLLTTSILLPMAGVPTIALFTDDSIKNSPPGQMIAMLLGISLWSFFFTSIYLLPLIIMFFEHRIRKVAYIITTEWGLLIYTRKGLRDAIPWEQLKNIERSFLSTKLTYDMIWHHNPGEPQRGARGRRRIWFIHGQETENLITAWKLAQGKEEDISPIII